MVARTPSGRPGNIRHVAPIRCAPVIPVERCIVGRELTEPRLSPDGSVVVYELSSAGRAALMWQPLDGSPVRQLTAHPAPRSGRGLGGGCWCWTTDGSAVV